MMKGWQVVPLGAVCYVEKLKYNNNSNLPYVGMEDIEGGTGRFIGSLEPQQVQSSTFKFTSNHLLYGRLRPYLNKVMMPRFSGHCSSEIFPIRVSEKLERSFLFYWFVNNQTVERINRTCTGARMPRANVKEVLNFEFPLPPLDEQKRIVAILDEAFEGIDRAIANTEKNLANARELFDSYLNNIFTQKGDGWVEKNLGEVCVKITDGKHGDCQNEENSGYFFLSAKDVKNDCLNYNNARQITKTDFEETHRRTNLEPLDILVTNSGTIGRTAIAPEDPKTYRTIFQKSVAILKPKKEIIDSIFCRYCLMANLSKIIDISAGTAQKNLLLRDIRAYKIFMPESLASQGEIAQKVTILSQETQRLEAIYKRKIEAVKELKQSILQKAFTGELTSETAKKIADTKETAA
ncbi:restriction endonuclease subunit S [Planktothricoides raciborskii]|uniref:Restriction endonuclease subunit S n=1 Tax=Planktothricoides raciborskii FACHB-1370 TaxID=2949576 RepID=A0ABR8EK73_9CYAN|nr:restriction endonuclease subunit S [Planktothricoides raciborskii]MBD2546524.1 restriction endonuclease subunit S [Planktothricoides raciborskii FACHB-1370]MBD2580697.1 restriction endonuclease subunit S [Planktothricoides raciborskii FACHB-1261]